MTSGTKLYEIVGEPLSAVSFVYDYVEFHFDGKIFRALTAPTVGMPGGAITFPQAGSRDILCSFIGKYVVDVIVRENDSIELYFDESGLIRVPLSEESRLGPEAAHFVPGENLPIEVW